jgi:hypothetical protein
MPDCRRKLTKVALPPVEISDARGYDQHARHRAGPPMASTSGGRGGPCLRPARSSWLPSWTTRRCTRRSSPPRRPNSASGSACSTSFSGRYARNSASARRSMPWPARRCSSTRAASGSRPWAQPRRSRPQTERPIGWPRDRRHPIGSILPGACAAAGAAVGGSSSFAPDRGGAKR